MKKIIKTLKENKSVKNFRVYKTETGKVCFGVSGKVIGGPYTPIQITSKIGGELQIEWKSGEVSFINITSSALENPKQTLNKAKSISYKDKYAKNFVSSYSIKSPINQYSQSIKKVINQDQEFLVDELKKLLSIETRVGVETHEALLSCSETGIEFVNSKGLYLSDKFTNYTVETNWKNVVYFELISRKIFRLNKFRDRISFLGKIFKTTNNSLKLKRFETRKPKVILSPECSWELLSFFVFGNLKGSAVANKMSRFSKKEFDKKKKVFADWFTLKVDPLRRLTSGASNFSYEGVKNKPTTFIENGKLVTPVLDLKHSQKLNMEPTTGVTSPHITTYCDKDIKTHKLEKFISQCSEAIYIPTFLGLHTQNKATGDYSLPCPYSIYIKDGKMIGSFKTIIVGNIFKELNDKVEFVKSDLYPLPGLCYTPKVIIE